MTARYRTQNYFQMNRSWERAGFFAIQLLGLRNPLFKVRSLIKGVGLLKVHLRCTNNRGLDLRMFNKPLKDPKVFKN